MLLVLAACAPDPLPSPPAAETPEPPEDTVPAPPVEEEPVDPTEPAPDPEVDDAAVVAVSFPTELACGEATTATVTMRNTGTTTWTRAAGYKLGAVGDQDDLITGDVRVWLDDADVVAPDGELTFDVPLVAPDAEALHTTDWQMVREGVAWFGEVTTADVDVACPENRTPDPLPGEVLPLPDLSWVVDDVAYERPDLLANSCQDYGGTWEFLDLVVDRLREHDTRWGYNWKRGVVGDPSQDVVDYHYGAGPDEGSTEVYILDVIGGHCGPNPQPAWTDVTQATLDGGTIGTWTGLGRF